MPAEPDSSPHARHLAAAAMRRWGLAGMAEPCDEVLLLIGELVTNAVVHGTGPIRLRLLLEERTSTLWCEVSDTSRHLPRPRAATPNDERGRGLSLLAALATTHGWQPAPGGKTVWFTRALEAS